ncbi:related to Cx9C motif-containing protein 4, mitochondrial [Fusarium oxysporum]|uniref:Cx9C motif-containing protein 4, mitochondrial n=2 Tax=Fusarium oxysporum species complex TaxID=171631 RepID=A0A2H3T329_FUSOX|nr:related to Cx9C motif-containing protein 4, mitochondrial [Fusarium oxysporum]
MSRPSLLVTHVHVQFKVFPPDTRTKDEDKMLTQTLQDCLTSNGYNEAKCRTAIKRLYECCEAFYERYGEDASTVSCPKPNLLRLKMKQLREEAK